MLSAGYRYFHALAQERSIRKAADRAHISPSAMSRQIAMLESELGQQLVERRARGVVLTPAGRLLLDHIRRLTQHEQDLRADLSSLSGLRAGEVRIAVGNGFAASVAAFTPAFMAQHPEIRCSIVVAASDGILRALDDEEVELGLSFGVPAHQSIEVVDSFASPLAAIVPAGHALARARKSVPVQALETERLALLRPSHGIRQILQKIQLQEGLRLNTMIESNSYEVLTSYVASGQGVTVLPRFSVLGELRRRRIQIVPLNHPVLASATTAIFKRRGHKLSVAAAEYVRTIVQELGGQAPSPAASQ